MTLRRLGQVALAGVAIVAMTAPAVGQVVRQQPLGTSSDRTPSRDDDAPSAAARDKSSRPTTADAKYDAGMAAIRAKNPGKAVELMRPVLADFEKQYAGEKRQIYCAMTPEQSSA